MSRKDEIKSAYRSLGKTHGIYDGQMLGTTRIGRWMLKHVWNMTREDALEYQAMAFEPIPAGFAGKLLEVPVGTGVLSMPVFQTLPAAEITCLDYSEKMMETARKRAKEAGDKERQIPARRRRGAALPGRKLRHCRLAQRLPRLPRQGRGVP